VRAACCALLYFPSPVADAWWKKPKLLHRTVVQLRDTGVLTYINGTVKAGPSSTTEFTIFYEQSEPGVGCTRWMWGRCALPPRCLGEQSCAPLNSVKKN